MSLGARLVAARTLVVLASVVLVVALVAGYARHAVVNSNQFANRATAALDDPSVRSLVAEKVTDDLVLKREADLLAARPIIQAAVSGVVGSQAFTKLFRSAVFDVHRAIFDRDQNTVVLTVADAGTVVAAALQQVRPKLADQLEAADRVELVRRDVGSAGGEVARRADQVKLLALILALLDLALVAGALVAFPNTRAGIEEIGIGAAAAGVLVIVAYGVLRGVVVGQVDGADEQAAAGAVWDAFLGDLRTSAWIVAGCGAVVAAAAASLLRPVDVATPLRRAVEWARREPSAPWLRALRGVVLVLAGIVAIVERDAVLSLGVTIGGVWLIYAGLTAVLRVIYRPPARATPREEIARRRAHDRWRLIAVPVVAAVLIAGTLSVFLASGTATTPAPARGVCDGHTELCDRPLDHVVLPATHNSMSAPLPGWFSSEQERPIAGQLADGIRGLLLDTHYADRLTNGKLRTEIGSDKALAQADGVSPDAVAAAQRIRDRLGFSGKGTRGMYLCHTFCELGGTTLSSVLEDIHTFLVSHPNEILVVINQDYVTPADFVGAVTKAGLADMVATPPPAGAAWPTLAKMIDTNRRLVFLAENHAGAAPWYQLVYKRLTEETPYTFKHVADLTDPAKLAVSCEPNRGPGSAPLFLINHWISTDPAPLPSNARKVNAYQPLLARARACRQQRHHLPNLLAVNFYREGDLFRVVDTLNGVG